MVKHPRSPDKYPKSENIENIKNLKYNQKLGEKSKVSHFLGFGPKSVRPKIILVCNNLRQFGHIFYHNYKKIKSLKKKYSHDSPENITVYGSIIVQMELFFFFFVLQKVALSHSDFNSHRL